MRVDRLMPDADVQERHAIQIGASPEAAWAALTTMDLSRSRLVRLLFRARGIPSKSITWADLEALGFTTVIDDPPHERALGLIAQPWKPRGGITRRADSDELLAFDDPGYAKILWSYAVTPTPSGSRVTTATLVTCTDADARRRFRRYWRVVAPFSSAIRRTSLRLLAEGVADPSR